MSQLLTPTRHLTGSVSRPPNVLAAARALRPRIWGHRDEIELDRRLPSALVDDMVAAGVFHMLTPRALGGLEVDLLTALSVIEEIATADGSTAWVLMINNNGGLVTGYLGEQAASEIYRHDRAIIAGALIPSGRAIPVRGGYRVSGQWAYASGVGHAAWVVAACRVVDGDEPTLGGDGPPEMRVMLVPADDVSVIDTWSVGGLRGTGSHDFAVADVFVPDERTFSPMDLPVQRGTLFRFPLRCVGAAGIAAVTLGIARGAIDALVSLASTKTPTMTRGPLRERALVQLQVPQAEALVRAARAWLVESVHTMWARVEAGRSPTRKDIALLRLAATHAATSAAQAVSMMQSIAGGTAIYTHCPIERAFRDVHAATQHFSIQPSMYEPIGRVLLDLPAGDALPL